MAAFPSSSLWKLLKWFHETMQQDGSLQTEQRQLPGLAGVNCLCGGRLLPPLCTVSLVTQHTEALNPDNLLDIPLAYKSSRLLGSQHTVEQIHQLSLGACQSWFSHWTSEHAVKF